MSQYFYVIVYQNTFLSTLQLCTCIYMNFKLVLCFISFTCLPKLAYLSFSIHVYVYNFFSCKLLCLCTCVLVCQYTCVLVQFCICIVINFCICAIVYLSNHRLLAAGYWTLHFNQVQANKGLVHPEAASSPVISNKQGQLTCLEAIAHFLDQVHIWWGPGSILHLHMGVIK